MKKLNLFIYILICTLFTINAFSDAKRKKKRSREYPILSILNLASNNQGDDSVNFDLTPNEILEIQKEIQSQIDRCNKKIKSSYEPSIDAKFNYIKFYKENFIKVKNKLKDALYFFKDPTYVHNTSIANNGGYGVYSLRDYKKGEVLPLFYPGIKFSFTHFDQLNDYLIEITQLEEEEQITKNKQILQYLKTKYDIHFSYDERVPHWDTFYDNLLAYRIENSHRESIIWNQYHPSGEIDAHPYNPKNAALFFNEPPPYKMFLNRLTLKNQLSRSNIMPKTNRQHQIVFVATENISKGDELLINYGPFYNRIINEDTLEEYPINYSEFSIDDYPIVDNLSREDTQRLINFREKIINYKHQGQRFVEKSILDETSIYPIGTILENE